MFGAPAHERNERGTRLSSKGGLTLASLQAGSKENNCLHMLIISDFPLKKIPMQISEIFSCY